MEFAQICDRVEIDAVIGPLDISGLPGTCPAGSPLRHGQSAAHSTPHSKGRTMRLLSSDVRRLSQSYIHCA